MALLSRHVLCALLVYLAVSPCVIDATGTSRAKFRSKFSSSLQTATETETQGMTDIIVLLLEFAYAAYNYNLFSKHEEIVSQRHSIQTGYNSIYDVYKAYEEGKGVHPEAVKEYIHDHDVDPTTFKRQLIQAIAAFADLELTCSKDEEAATKSGRARPLSPELQEFHRQLQEVFDHAKEVVRLMTDLETHRTCSVEEEEPADEEPAEDETAETETSTEPESRCKLSMLPDDTTPATEIQAAPESFFKSLAKSAASGVAGAYRTITGLNWRRLGQSAASVVGAFSNAQWRSDHWAALKTSMLNNYLALTAAAGRLKDADKITKAVTEWWTELSTSSKFHQSVMLTALMTKMLASLPRITMFLKKGVEWINNDPTVTTLFAASSFYNIFNMLMVIFTESPFAVPAHTYLALFPWMVNIMVVVTDDSCAGRLSAMYAAHKLVYHNKDVAKEAAAEEDLEEEDPEEEDDPNLAKVVKKLKIRKEVDPEEEVVEEEEERDEEQEEEEEAEEEEEEGGLFSRLFKGKRL